MSTTTITKSWTSGTATIALIDVATDVNSSNIDLETNG